MTASAVGALGDGTPGHRHARLREPRLGPQQVRGRQATLRTPHDAPIRRALLPNVLFTALSAPGVGGQVPPLRAYPGQVGCYVFTDTTGPLPIPKDRKLRRAGFRLDSAPAMPPGRALLVGPLRGSLRSRPAGFPTSGWEPRSPALLVLTLGGLPVENDLVVTGEGRDRIASLTIRSDVGGVPAHTEGRFALVHQQCRR